MVSSEGKTKKEVLRIIQLQLIKVKLLGIEVIFFYI